MRRFRFLAFASPILATGLCAADPVKAPAAPAPAAPEAKAKTEVGAEKKEDFIRVDEDEQAARLQTALLRYQKGKTKVDLVGAVHIADKAYYEDLQKRFDAYDAVLFEMVGGDKIDRLPAGPDEKREASGLSKLYSMVAKFLELTEQSNSLDYRRKNFVHADLTLEEFTRLQSERKESLLSFAIKNSVSGDKSKEPDPQKLLRAVLSGKPNKTKLELVHTLGGGDDQVAALAGESVIITDRNKKAVEVLDQQLAQGRNHLAIFYGAAHFPDLNQRMLERGFRLMNTEWLTAWNIPKVEPEPEVKPEAAADVVPAPAVVK